MPVGIQTVVNRPFYVLKRNCPQGFQSWNPGTKSGPWKWLMSYWNKLNNWNSRRILVGYFLTGKAAFGRLARLLSCAARKRRGETGERRTSSAFFTLRLGAQFPKWWHSTHYPGKAAFGRLARLLSCAARERRGETGEKRTNSAYFTPRGTTACSRCRKIFQKFWPWWDQDRCSFPLSCKI